MMRCFPLLSLLTLLTTLSISAAPDPTTLDNKVMCGYQGWFTAAGDDNPFSIWIHWATGHANPNGTNLIVEMYPDFSEFDSDELFATAMTKDGGAASLYSGRTAKTINRHARWMREYGIDGVFAQRFVQVLGGGDTAYIAHLNAVRETLLTSCEEYERVFAVMYDVSGANESTFWDTMRNDWIILIDSGMVNSTNYIHHNGKPVVGIWGFGFKDGVHPPVDSADAQTIIDWFQTTAPTQYQATVFGGVPSYWRTLSHDSRTGAGWADVYRSFDVISPWSVGRYANQAEANNWKLDRIIPDLTEAQIQGIDYSPVIWPGFSWKNLTGGPTNQIPRDGGNFYWRQAYNAVSAGATNMIYVAMFDEVDEATAIYKVAPTAADAPDQGYWLTLDADGYSLPSDWYLRLTYELGNMLRNNTPTSITPTDPGPHFTEQGTPLAWLESYGLIGKAGFESADAGDTDLDSMSAGDEYIAGTIPTNASSLFHEIEFQMLPGIIPSIIWYGGTNGATAPYEIYSTTNLVETSWQLFGTKIREEGTNLWTGVAATEDSRYYRVLATP